MPESPVSEPNGSVVTVDFVRHRNALLVRGDLGPLFVDYILHLADQELKYTPEQTQIFRDSLAAFALHCVSRPKGEHIAWTLNFQSPRLNVFLTGDNEDHFVTGRLFTENIREAAHNVFYSDGMARRGAEKQRSVVNFDGPDAFRAAEAYYATSEQRLARYFDLGEDQYALLISHPDCDEAWLKSAALSTVRALAETETLARIERRLVQWRCGCSQAKILGTLAAAARPDMDGFFGADESLRVQCPRCAATHVITREAMEAVLAKSNQPAG